MEKNKDMVAVLQELKGKGVTLTFHNTGEDDYRTGMIKEVLDSVVVLQYKEVTEPPDFIEYLLYIDINAIKCVFLKTPPDFDNQGFFIGDLRKAFSGLHDKE